MLIIYALRMPADPFARSAVSPQRSLLAAQFSRSAVSVIPSKLGRGPDLTRPTQRSADFMLNALRWRAVPPTQLTRSGDESFLAHF